jgi:hypothetical protein
MARSTGHKNTGDKNIGHQTWRHGARARFLATMAMTVALAACGGAPEAPVTTTVKSVAAASQITATPPLMPIDETAYPAAPPRADKARTIGLLLPMGDARDAIRQVAGHLYNAAQLALFDAGQEHLVLRLHDTRGTPDGALQAGKAAIVGKSDILVGPLFGSSAAALKPLLAGRTIPAFAFSNDASAAGDNLFLLGFLPEQNIDRIVSEAIAQGLTRFAALLPQGVYGARIGNDFRLAVERFGGTVVETETYPPEAKDMFEPVKRLAQYDRRKAAHAEEVARMTAEALALLPRRERLDEASGEMLAVPPPSEPDDVFAALGDSAPELVSAYEALTLTETLGEIPYDAVFMPEGGLALRNLAPLLPYFDIDPRRVKFIGTGLWDDPTLSQEPPLHGGWFAASPGHNWSAFQARYEKAYGDVPPRLAAMAYDAVSLAARLALIDEAAPYRPDLLTDPNGFVGIDGILRLTADGLNERGLAVREITRREAREISAAPASFVEHDRRLRAAFSLADALRRSNPDLDLQSRSTENDGTSDTFNTGDTRSGFSENPAETSPLTQQPADQIIQQ